MKFRILPLLAILALVSSEPALAKSGGGSEDPSVVSEVDYARYVGLWYEIGHFPNFFQGACVRSTAEYQAIGEGKVSVHNVCYRENLAPTDIRGTAFAPDRMEPAKLKVDFGFPRLGDYWIIDLDSEYRWAVVSGPKKESLFILAREAPMAQATLNGILSRLKAKGFDTAKIIYDKY